LSSCAAPKGSVIVYTTIFCRVGRTVPLAGHCVSSLSEPPAGVPCRRQSCLPRGRQDEPVPGVTRGGWHGVGELTSVICTCRHTAALEMHSRAAPVCPASCAV
jgi:hypothetical protein